MNSKSIIAIILCGTVCTVILIFSIAAVFYPPATVTETARVKLFELLIYMLGIVSGFLIGKSGPDTPPEPPKKEVP